MLKLSVNLIGRFKRHMIGRHTYRTAQNSIPSEYGPTTTAQEVIAGCDLSGKVAVVTGGYSGLGLETVRILSKAGAFVVVPPRNPAKAKRAFKSNRRSWIFSILRRSTPLQTVFWKVIGGFIFSSIMQGSWQGACIISMSSRAHRRALFDFEDPNFERRPRCLVPAFDGSG